MPDFITTCINLVYDIVYLIQNLVKTLRGDPTVHGPDDFKVIKPRSK